MKLKGDGEEDGEGEGEQDGDDKGDGDSEGDGEGKGKGGRHGDGKLLFVETSINFSLRYPVSAYNAGIHFFATN